MRPASGRGSADEGVTGYPAMLLVMERFGYPDYLQSSAEDLIENQYADRPATRPIYDAFLALLPEVGEIEVQARKTYVALPDPEADLQRPGADDQDAVRPGAPTTRLAEGFRQT